MLRRFQVNNVKLGKMQGELMALCQMQSEQDAMACVREMHGVLFKSKYINVRYVVRALLASPSSCFCPLQQNPSSLKPEFIGLKNPHITT